MITGIRLPDVYLLTVVQETKTVQPGTDVVRDKQSCKRYRMRFDERLLCYDWYIWLAGINPTKV